MDLRRYRAHKHTVLLLSFHKPLIFYSRSKKDKTVRWYKNGTLLMNTKLAKTESFRVKISSKGYLKFAKIKLKDAGRYTCTFKAGARKKKWIIKGTATDIQHYFKCVFIHGHLDT